jgi:hypothetical protein
MAKPTKRQRKFNATGGIKSRIDKGTTQTVKERERGETFGTAKQKGGRRG